MSDAFLYGNGGAGVKLSVKAYETKNRLPETATENTIAVITDVAITGYTFAAAEPLNPTAGMVWFLTEAGCGRVVAVTTNNPIMVYPAACNQYISGKWLQREAWNYGDGSWKPWSQWLIENGQTSHAIIAVGKPYWAGYIAMTGLTVTQNDDSIEIVGNSDGYGMAYIENIDLSDYTTLTIEGMFTQNYKDPYRLAVWSDVGTCIENNMVISEELTATGVTLDVSGLHGEHAIGITTAGKYTQIINNLILR